MKDEFIQYKDYTPFKELFKRRMWRIVCSIFYKPFSSNIFNKWRLLLLRLMGAKIGKGSIIYSSVFIPTPWNLVIGDFSCLGPNVQLHVGKITIGNKVTISQRSYLCSGTHDITSLNKPFYSKEIIIEDYCWIAAEAFIGPGVIIKKGAVVGARAVVFKNIDSWAVVVGNPAKVLKKRQIINRS